MWRGFLISLNFFFLSKSDFLSEEAHLTYVYYFTVMNLEPVYKESLIPFITIKLVGDQFRSWMTSFEQTLINKLVRRHQ